MTISKGLILFENWKPWMHAIRFAVLSLEGELCLSDMDIKAFSTSEAVQMSCPSTEGKGCAVWVSVLCHSAKVQHRDGCCQGGLVVQRLERRVSLQLIEDLRKELEHLQLYKLECERPGRGRSSSSSVSEFNAKTREVEMEHEIKRLKQVSREGPHSVWVSPKELCRTAQKNPGSCMCQYGVLRFLYPRSL